MTLNYAVQVKKIVSTMSDKLPAGMFEPAINLSRKFKSLLVWQNEEWDKLKIIKFVKCGAYR